jgi:hypothetical protein
MIATIGTLIGRLLACSGDDGVFLVMMYNMWSVPYSTCMLAEVVRSQYWAAFAILPQSSQISYEAHFDHLMVTTDASGLPAAVQLAPSTCCCC